MHRSPPAIVGVVKLFFEILLIVASVAIVGFAVVAVTQLFKGQR